MLIDEPEAALTDSGGGIGVQLHHFERFGSELPRQDEYLLILEVVATVILVIKIVLFLQFAL
jgi:hypothetical protein